MTTSESASMTVPADEPTTHPLGDAPAVKDAEVPTLAEKIVGIKEEIQGTITHDPQLVQHGKDLLSGAAHVEPHEQMPEEKAAEPMRMEPVDNTVCINMGGLK